MLVDYNSDLLDLKNKEDVTQIRDFLNIHKTEVVNAVNNKCSVSDTFRQSKSFFSEEKKIKT